MKRRPVACAPWLALCAALAACGDDGAAGRRAVPGREGAEKTVAALRAGWRAYDGAPPVVPHAPFGGECGACHSARGMAVEGVGFAPPSPHGRTPGMGAARCEQCHVERRTEALFVASAFEGFAQDLRRGPRQHEAAPPVIPHPRFMREDCGACHAGPAAREEIRSSHPERANCLQCHLERVAAAEFER